MSKIANLIVVSIITMIRLETLYPKNAVIDRLRSKYAFEDKIFCGGGQGAQGGQEGQEHPEENRTERYLTPLKAKPGFSPGGRETTSWLELKVPKRSKNIHLKNGMVSVEPKVIFFYSELVCTMCTEY